MSSDNGQLPASALSPIGGGFYLANHAAAAFRAMDAEAYKRYGTRLQILAAYRTLATQWYFWNLYRSGRGNLAAYPGSSNHGQGVAIDCANHRTRWIIDQIGAKYGWSKRWSDAPSEWWHIRFIPSYVTVNLDPIPPTLKRGDTGARVAALQVRLRALGFVSIPSHGKTGFGYYGASTASAVRRFQKAHHLHVDGQVGPVTAKTIKNV